MTINQEVEAGQAVYTPLTLAIYDWFVLGFSNNFLWRCPTSELRALYKRNTSGNHLDIGVGTGYFLDKAQWPVANPSITLVDLNQNSLNAAAKRINRYNPKSIVANALEPMDLPEKYDSAGLCYLLHCVPGSIPEKAVIFDQILPHMSPKATIFGATILQGNAPASRPAQMLMDFYNKKGIFSNTRDRLEDLEPELKKRFDDVKIQCRGTVALFEARVPTLE